ncbi:MAG: hypothetical protein JXQ75_13700 [Phycisphaerae bacterium]|nr:hypothetical protein [Phycisphaerae bacterium]
MKYANYVNLMMLILLVSCSHDGVQNVPKSTESDSLGDELPEFRLFSPEPRFSFPELKYQIVSRGAVYLLAQNELCYRGGQELMGLHGRSFTLGPCLPCGDTHAKHERKRFYVSHVGLLSARKDGQSEEVAAVPPASDEGLRDFCAEVENGLKTRRDQDDYTRESLIAVYLARDPMGGGKLIRLLFSTKVIPGEPGRLRSTCVSASFVTLDEQASGTGRRMERPGIHYDRDAHPVSPATGNRGSTAAPEPPPTSTTMPNG